MSYSRARPLCPSPLLYTTQSITQREQAISRFQCKNNPYCVRTIIHHVIHIIFFWIFTKTQGTNNWSHLMPVVIRVTHVSDQPYGAIRQLTSVKSSVIRQL